jgi:SAM-dependent methyltransferase
MPRPGPASIIEATLRFRRRTGCPDSRSHSVISRCSLFIVFGRLGGVGEQAVESKESKSENRVTAMPPERQPNDASYEQIGLGYSRARRTEPRIAARIFAALGDARTVLNVGAGTGSYEPPDRDVLAVEPSRVMRSQRPPGAASCIDARAEALPFPDQSFDAALAVLSDHHWSDPIAGLREMRRVARRVIVFQWDDTQSERFWLVRDYLLPEYRALTAGGPTLRERAAAIDARMEPVPIPCDVIDGFFHAYWRRPAAY